MADGIYKPDDGASQTLGDRNATFQLISSVILDGGYAGCAAPDPEAHDPILYLSTLSGDLAGNDIPPFGNNGENAFHVLTASSVVNVELRNLKIVGGNGNSGAGILVNSSSITMKKCIVFGNKTGGGSDGGGAIAANGSSVSVESSLFRDNGGGGYGGAVRTKWPPSDLSFVRCRFEDNQSWDTGAVYVRDRSSAKFEGCIFEGNRSSNSVGAVAVMHGCCASPVTFTNCLFANNRTTYAGGAIYLWGASVNPTITSCTFVGNSANQGGAIFLVNNGASAVIKNSVFWSNLRNQIKVESNGSIPSVSFSLVQGGFPGASNIDADPLFLDPDGADNVPGNEDDNLRLSLGSPAIDAGDNDAVPVDTNDLDNDGNTTEPIPYDLDNDPRFVDDPNTVDTGNGTAPIVDMGAYEGPDSVPPIVLTEGNLNLVEGDIINRVVASFIDNVAETHTSTIDWGVGIVTVGTVDQAADTVTGNHAYGDNGNYTVTVTVDDGITSSLDSFDVIVANSDPFVNAGADQVVTVGEVVTLQSESLLITINNEGTLIPFTVLARTTKAIFADLGFDVTTAPSIEDFSAEVDWGNGTGTQPAVVVETPGSIGVPTTGTIAASTVYTAPGIYAFNVTIFDDDGGSATDRVVITVKPVSPITASTPHDITKDRYLTFDPSTNTGNMVALRVTRVDSATPWYVNCTLQDAGADGKLGELVQTAEYCDWTDSVIHVRGCEIVPGNEYLVEATANDVIFSSPLTIFTTAPQFSASRHFGDLVGSFAGGVWTAPEGLVTTNDIVAVVQKFQLLGSAPHLSRVDNDGKTPNGIIASNDILRVVLGFAGGDFGFGVTDCLTGTWVPSCP